MKKPATPALPPRASAVSRADLLWLLHSLGESEAADAAALAGFAWKPAEEAPPSPPVRQTEVPAEKALPAAPEATRRPPLQATHFAAIEYQSFPEETEPAEEETNGPIFDDVSGSGQTPPPRIALSPPRRLAVFLRQHLRPASAGKELDVASLLAHLARASLPRRLPRRAQHRWSEDAALLIDLSLAAFPLNDDLIDLAEQAQTLSGGRLSILAHEPAHGWLERKPGLQPAWAPSSEARLRAARHWLLAGDLGSLDPDKAHRRNWQRRLRRHLAAGGQVTLLAGAAPAAWSANLPRQTRVALWDHGRRIVPTHGRAGRPRQASAAGVELLLASLSLAVRVEPSLLRQVRLDLGLPMPFELAVWNHADVENCHLGMQIRPDRLEHYRALASTGLKAEDRRHIAGLIQHHHQGLSQLIRMEEAALAADLAGQGKDEAEAQWSKAVRTLTQQPESTAARALASFLGRTGRRAHTALWRAIPQLADAYVIAHRNALRAGAEVPAGVSARTLNRHMAAGPEDEARPLWIVQFGPYLVVRPLPPIPGQFTLAESPPANGFEFEAPDKPMHWRAAPMNSRRLGNLVAGAGPWTIQTPWIKAVIAEIPRPSWAIEWGRDGEGLFALAPSPLGQAVKLSWAPPGYGEPFRWPPADRGYNAPKVPIGEGMWLGADLEFGLFLDVPFGNTTQRFRYIEPGEFLMGSTEDEPVRLDNEGPQHVVRITEGFWLAETACSQALWESVTGANPSHFMDDPQNPVEQVSWDDVQGFLRQVESLLPGVKADLPTEAEWEYACRAGTQTAFSFGNRISTADANYDGSAYADGPTGESRYKTVTVKSFPPNPWGLYQMHGNVWEWCADAMRDFDGSAQTDPGRGTDGAADAPRALRGGSWDYWPWGLRSAFRDQDVRGWRHYDVGFRFSLRSMAQAGGAERLPEAQEAALEGPQGASPAPGRSRGAGAETASTARRNAGPSTKKSARQVNRAKNTKPSG